MSAETDDDDKTAFRRAMDDMGVDPLDNDTRHGKIKDDTPLPQKKQRLKPTPFIEADRESIKPFMSYGPTPGPESILTFQRGSLPKRRYQRFAGGTLPLEGSLDLHGLTQRQAHMAIDDFLTESVQQHKSCVRIIHGKGDSDATLKHFCKCYLPTSNKVLAFVSCKPRHGGTGAIYVLLKQQGKQNAK